jgi:hypothetical protein
MPTIRSLIADMQREIRDTDLQPDRAAELLTRLSALYGNVLDEIRAADMEYAQVLLTALNGDEAASRAKIRAEISPQYQRKREAHDTEKLVQELNRALKYFLRAKEAELREMSR